MLYQKLLLGNKPYLVSAGEVFPFEIHRHPEIELSFCISGEYDIICENKRQTLSCGDLAVILPMSSHEFPPGNSKGECLTIEVGYAMLGDFFDAFTNRKEKCLIYRKNEQENPELYRELCGLLNETAELRSSDTVFSELSIKGNLYKISALILQMLHSLRSEAEKIEKLTDIVKIDKALDIIYSRYSEPLSVEEISGVCGYSKSNFCKIFKSITGDTFHHTLNRHRVDIACMLLMEGSDTVEQIAIKTGFSDTKSFCRVFKQFTGESTRAFKKRVKSGVSPQIK